MGKAEDKVEQKPVEELNRELAELQLQNAKDEQQIRAVTLRREKISLKQTEKDAKDFEQREEAARLQNEEREQGFRTAAANLRTLQKGCEHRSGGYAGETPITEGDGPSVLHITVMPDQVTEFIQCPRCRLRLFGRPRTAGEETKLRVAAEAAEKANSRTFESNPDWIAWDNHEWWKELRATHKKMGYKKSVMRGPTFSFKTLDGIPVIPEPTVPLKTQIRKLAKAG